MHFSVIHEFIDITMCVSAFLVSNCMQLSGNKSCASFQIYFNSSKMWIWSDLSAAVPYIATDSCQTMGLLNFVHMLWWCNGPGVHELVSADGMRIRFNNNNGFLCIWVVAIFTVMCYNVLCDKYATRQLYGYCPSWALNWQHRRRHIFEEIHHYGADVISLQVTFCTVESKPWNVYSWNSLPQYAIAEL